jgi:ankyrin repeat protein
MTSLGESFPFYLPYIEKKDHVINAILEKDLPRLQSLLENASLEKINYRGYNTIGGFSALHISALVGWIDGVKFLLEKGAILESRDYQYKTSIHYAVYGKNYDMVQFLLNKGIEIKGNEVKDTPLYLAYFFEGNEKIFQLLAIHFSKIYYLRKFLQSLLYNAVQNDRVEIVDILLQNGANVNMIDPKRKGYFIPSEPIIVLHIAARFGNISMIKILLQNGADINAIDPLGRNSYQVAAFFGHKDVCAFFIENGHHNPIFYFQSKFFNFYDIEEKYNRDIDWMKLYCSRQPDLDSLEIIGKEEATTAYLYYGIFSSLNYGEKENDILFLKEATFKYLNWSIRKSFLMMLVCSGYRTLKSNTSREDRTMIGSTNQEERIIALRRANVFSNDGIVRCIASYL